MTGDAARAREKAVVLLSGGLDSCVCTAEAVREFRPALLHLNYGQRTESRELAAFHDIADHYGAADRLVVDLDWWREIGGSSLLAGGGRVETGLPGPGVPSTYVSFRNAGFLSIATAWAETIGARALFIGAVEEDSSGYPDCTEDFYRAFAGVIDAGTRPETRIELRTPLLHMDKAAIVARGRELDAPLHLSWSCYTGGDRACGVCESCRLRLRGFAAAGETDPAPYAE